MKCLGDYYHIAFVCDDSSSNSMGRVLTLWELAEQAGMCSVIVVANRERIWSPLEDSRMVESIFAMDDLERDQFAKNVTVKVIVCVKPKAATLNIALPWCKRDDIPLVLDIDDADVEAGLSFGYPIRAFAKSILRRREMKWLRWVQSNYALYATTVSNPVLQEAYGGLLIPHVHKFDDDFVLNEPANPLSVAFVGTIRPHKGVSQLRESVAAISDRGFALTITGEAPRDARSWETWVSKNTLSEGRQIVADAGIVAIPSLDMRYANSQLPSKLIEAMTMGKAIVASDLPPIRWALGDAGILVAPGNVEGLSQAIASLEDQDLRRQYQERARVRSRQMFAIEDYASAFREFLEKASGSTIADR